MQDIRIRFERNAIASAPNNISQSLHGSSSNNDTLKFNLFHHNLTESIQKTSASIDSIIKSSSISSGDDNSPTELNNCRRLTEKPPLVKRLTMGILRNQEDSRPLMHNKSSSLTSSDSIHTISDGYVNEGICDSEKLITSKFGDSCKQSFNQMTQLSSSAQQSIPMQTLKPISLPKNTTITTAMVHHVDKSSNFHNSNCYNNSMANYNETVFNDFDFKKNFTTTNLKLPPILPLRNDALSLSEQMELSGAPWFQAGLPREISLEILAKQNPGAFLVRQSTSKTGCFALSLRVPPPSPKVAHYLILRTPRGFKIKGFTKEFTSLRALITHHSVMKELLPVSLALPRPQNVVQPRKEDLDDLDNLWFIK